MKAIASGELLIDFNSVSTDEAGYPTLEGHPGGATINCLATLRNFGAEAAFIGKAGNDAFGKMLQHTIRQLGIDTTNVLLTEEAFTTLAFVTLDETGDREFSFARKPGADLLLRFEEIDLSVFDGADVFHFGTVSMTKEPSRETTKKLVEYARSKGILIGYDPNLRKNLWDNLEDAREQMLWGLSQADVVKISDEEIEFLFGLEPEEGAQKILDLYHVKLVYATCGAKGCYYNNRKVQGFMPAMKGIHVIDTCGAGDIFGGSAMFRFLQHGKEASELTKDDLDDITHFASTAAGLSTQKHGGISSIPALSDVLRAL
ncbi:MAG: carbohydrate kinase [Oscillospiraceae bacterium]|nr:carbohydrate kinase [Oscillospiraceae bacterium]